MLDDLTPPPQDYSSVGNDLFGEAPPGGDDTIAPVLQEPTAPVAPPPVEPLPMPKAWKKENEPLWAKLDRQAQEYINTRESDVVRGIDMYSKGHKSWTELISPFEPVLQQHPNVNPVQVLQTLMRNHLALSQGTPEQKKTLAQQLFKAYGLNPAELAAQPQAPNLPPEYQALQNELGQVKQVLSTFQQAQQAQAVNENLKLVQAFASDPKNEFFSEVSDDILRFLQTGAADSIQSAYELAIWANPAVRVKVMAKQASPQPPAPAPLQVNGSGDGTPRPKKPETIEDTIAAVVAKNYGPH